MNASNQAERAEVLRQLERQRQRIEAMFGKKDAPRTGMSDALQSGFPRSQVMRLLISEPILMSGLSALTVSLFGPRAMQVLRALTIAFRATRNVSKERGVGSP